MITHPLEGFDKIMTILFMIELIEKEKKKT